MIRFQSKSKLGGSISLAAAMAALFAGVLPSQAADPVTFKVEAPFDDVRFDLESAIINRGLVIDHTSHVGEMLARTKEDVGGTKDIFGNGDVMLFCSAALSRKVMEADPLNIGYCPYSVFVFDTPDAPGQVTVGYMPLDERGNDASKAAIAEVNALLDELAREAAGQ
ncbi:DUF302 domain-containing protein [Roseibium litorale]|uniref:DUF302 domain-containing protein n=1 Tax=Roseibium litorale TaxID=2803841 RepID=A0ABR9CSM1_9HYPH|nr:DUF302 domain-containing protein [Roseibium litorale]MBD8893410.1 DUF302 domain-containing protein [Roseibium litorale]